MTDLKLQELATKYVDDYLDMGCFKEPEKARPFLIEGFIFGFKEKESANIVEQLRKEWHEKLIRLTNKLAVNFNDLRPDEIGDNLRNSIEDVLLHMNDYPYEKRNEVQTNK